jgi:long-chain acyl-CoA synthetase
VKDVELRIDPGYRGRPHTGDHDHAQGEILARGPGVFHGYRNLPRETEKVLTPEGWFRTGDLGYIDSDGYLHLTGRVSTMIVTEGGENIQPDTVEHMYTDHPLIKEAGVLERNQRLVGLIVPDIREMENRNITGIEKAVRRAVDERSRTMPSYMRLSHVQVTRKALPRTRLGKIRRHLLASRYDDAQEASAPSKGRPVAYDEMSDADRALLEDQTARRVWEWLCERFRDAALTPDTSPRMELNIDSMEWLNLTLEIRARTGVEIGEEAIARVDTVRDLLKEAAEAASNTEPAADPVDSPYEVLTREQQKWVQPLGPGMHILSQCAYWLTSSLLRLLYRIHTQGLEQVPEKRACVLTPNHASYLDPFVLGHVLGPGSMSHTYWAGMTTAAFDTAAKRFGSRLGRGMPIAPRRGALSALAFASVILKRHQRLVWFPEGRRSTDGTLQEFKPGLGKILDTFPVPVVPVWIEGTHEAWPVGRQVPRPGRITILFGEPVAVDTLKSAGDGPHTEQRIMSGLRQRMLALNPAE